MFKFLLTLLLTAIVIGSGVLWGAHEALFHKPSFFLKTLIFLTATTAIIYVYLCKVKRPDLFLQLYLLTMAVKLLTYCVYNYIMIKKDRPEALENIIFFMLTYFVFTALEIGFLHYKITGRTKR